MKQKITLFAIFLLFVSCKAQIIPVEQVIGNYDMVEEGQTNYIKDINNVLDDYVGTWIGNYNNKNYTFIITKTTIIFDEKYNIDADILLMKHLIAGSTTSDIIEDTTLLSDKDAHSSGLYFDRFSSGGLSYVFDYGGDYYDCGRMGEVVVTLFNDKTQMYLIMIQGHDTVVNYDEECPGGEVEQVLPTERIALTKK